MRVLTDFHHSSLLRSTNMLFGDRLGMDVYRPIGMEWFNDGYWAINDQKDTAEQFLYIGSQPIDETPELNNSQSDLLPGTYLVDDPGGDSTHRACTLEFFKNNKFDYVIASIPAHIPLFRKLIERYNPKAKLIVQIGNEWPKELFARHNVLASVKPTDYGPETNAVFYHQEFDLDIFHPSPNPDNEKIYSFINVLQNMPVGWRDFNNLEMFLKPRGFKFASFGGQCRDGNMTGPQELADKMREAMMIFHVKDGGDGYGHIIYNAYAVGRPIITRSSLYKNRLAEELLLPGTFIDLDKHNLPEAITIIDRLQHDPILLDKMSQNAAQRFKEVVNFDKEAEEIKQWLNNLK